MNPKNKSSSSSGFGVHDVLYIVFKHKWKIIMLSLVGFTVAGAMAIRILRDPTFESTAQLMVQYVVERTNVDPEAGDRMMSGGMATEIAILTSRNTAIEVAEAIGPEKFLPDASTPPTAEEVAGLIKNGLEVVNPPGTATWSTSNLLYLTYRNSDPDLTAHVLDELIKVYFKRHLELHRSTETFSQVSKQTDEARSKLRQTEEEINQLKDKSGILTIESTMAEFEARKQIIRENLMTAESRLAEQSAKVEALRKSQKLVFGASVDEALQPPGEDASSKEPLDESEKSESKRQRSIALAEYNDLTARLELLQTRRRDLLVTRKPGDPMVSFLDKEISQVRRMTLDLDEEYPDFSGKLASSPEGRLIAPVLSIEDEEALEFAFKARLESVRAQAKGLESEVARISSLGFQLQDLERRRQLEEEKYRYAQSSLEKAILDEKLDPNKIPNIKTIETPSPPLRSIDKKKLKLILGIAGSGLAAGLALAFLIEMVIDRRVSRPVEIQTRLQLPLMLSIPYIRSKDQIAMLVGGNPNLETADDTQGGNLMLALDSGRRGGITADKRGEHFITPYVDAIHDRITFNFQVNNIKHKPKLVALTGLSEGAGTSTIAAGLARAFAENGSRKVLLVDMNPAMGSTRAIGEESLFKALEFARTERFRLSSRNLYFANASTRRDSRDSHALAPTAFHEIMPSLVSSDFDYIIFDLPQMGPTSPTLTMAGFMDKVLLVLDGDKTTRDNLSWGYTELEKAKADVSCIFNKARSHAPRWVQGEV